MEMMGSNMASSQKCARSDNNELWNMVGDLIHRKPRIPHLKRKQTEKKKVKTHQETKQEKELIVAKIRPRGNLKRQPENRTNYEKMTYPKKH